MAAAQQAALDEEADCRRRSPPANVSVSVNNNIANGHGHLHLRDDHTCRQFPACRSTMTVTRTVNVPVLPQNPGYAYGSIAQPSPAPAASASASESTSAGLLRNQHRAQHRLRRPQSRAESRPGRQLNTVVDTSTTIAIDAQAVPTVPTVPAVPAAPVAPAGQAARTVRATRVDRPVRAVPTDAAAPTSGIVVTA